MMDLILKKVFVFVFAGLLFFIGYLVLFKFETNYNTAKFSTTNAAETVSTKVKVKRAAAKLFTFNKTDSTNIDKNSAGELDKLNLNVNITGVYKEKDLEHCKSLVYQGLESLPENHRLGLKNLTLVFDAEARRGLAGSDKLKIRCINMDDKELMAVLVHEMGHITDIAVMEGTSKQTSNFVDGKVPVYTDDKSVNFYQISWKNNTDLKTTDEKNFVSTYAMTDPFEDFAESYNYYFLHGADFRAMAKENTMLSQKYDFLKKKVFQNQEFDLDEKSKIDLNIRNYDVTVLDY